MHHFGEQVCLLIVLTAGFQRSAARRNRQYDIETDLSKDQNSPYNGHQSPASSSDYASQHGGSGGSYPSNSGSSNYPSSSSNGQYSQGRSEYRQFDGEREIRYTSVDPGKQGELNNNQNTNKRRRRRKYRKESQKLNKGARMMTPSLPDYLDTQQIQAVSNDQRLLRREQKRLQLQSDQFKKQIPHKLLIIVIDGFRWDYLEQYQRNTGEPLPGFKDFQSGGVRAEYLETVFPAESFPAWQTLQTGLYPENHDIVGNQFYDREVHKQKGDSNLAFFNIEDERHTENQKWFQKDEPFWATAKRHNLSFAAYLWGRCDVPYDAGVRFSFEFCEHLYEKDGTKTLRTNVDKALNLFQSGYDGAIIYEDALERVAEDHGPNSHKMDKKLEEIDAMVNHLSKRLNQTSMADIVNVMILSDHGMSAVSAPPSNAYNQMDPIDEVETEKIQLSKILTIRNQVKWVVGSGSHVGVYPREKKYRADVIKLLEGVKGIQVYDQNDIPERFHYKRSPNAPPILVVANPGSIILPCDPNVQRPASQESNSRFNMASLRRQFKYGFSGYDPEEEDMRGIFMAKGPAFKDTGETRGPVKLVDVYELICKVLEIPARSNNGTLADIIGFLKGGSEGVHPLSITLGVAVLVLTLSS